MMKRQRVIQTKKESIPPQMRGLLPHSAVRTTPDHNIPSPGSAKIGFGHDFSQVAIRPTTPIVSLNYSKASCPIFPQRCPFGGACHTCPPRIQAKLKVGQPGDKYEQEADRVADNVMKMAEPHVQCKGCLSCSDTDEDELIQTKLGAGCNALLHQKHGDEKDSVERIKCKESLGHTPRLTEDVQKNIYNLKGRGNSLSEFERSFFEPRFGYNFRQIRVHSGAHAARLTRAVNARAFTLGRDVVFGAGQYAPETREGRELLAHELAHVIQQNSEGSKLIGSSTPSTRAIQRQPNTGNLFLRLGEGGRVEVLYGTPDLPVTGPLGIGFRCQNGRCVMVGGQDPTGGKRTYSVEEARDLLTGGGDRPGVGLCPLNSINPTGCCSPGEMWLGTRCGTPPARITHSLCPPGALLDPVHGCTNPGQGPSFPNFQLEPPSLEYRGHRNEVIDRFTHNKDTVPTSASGRLDWIAIRLVLGNVLAIIVEGHTDSTGAEEYNLDLSLRRANAVKQALIFRGVQADRIAVEGKGESELSLGPERSHEDHAINRRVEIFWLLPASERTPYHLGTPTELRLESEL